MLSRKRINPNSSIRSGYSYEDLFVMKLCADWLNSADKYSEIKVQFIPEEIRDTHFALDDIVAQRKNGDAEYYQVKHVQNPDLDLWDSEKIVSKGLEKWVKSFFALKSAKKECVLFTNAKLHCSLEECYRDYKFDIQKLKSSNVEFYNCLLANGYREKELKTFFESFEFRFNQPNKKTLEEELRNHFYQKLKVTVAGVDRLLLYINEQGSEKEPKSITLQEIRSKLSWDNPRPLNQNFFVPGDFEFFDKKTHEDILEDLSNVDGGIKVFTGKPGSGKSTYLSKLYNILQKKGYLVFRHHYHLNPKDTTFYDRLNSKRVVEGLKAEFKKQKNSVLDGLAEQNTAQIQLKVFIDTLSSYSVTSKVPFILIIDGLDHVIREGNSQRELIDFLNEILFPQTGYWLIIGTQEIATDSFPNAIHDYAPKDKWIEIKGLNRQSIKSIINKAFPKKERDHGVYDEKIISKIYALTQGNPLHLRYVLSEITNQKMHLSSYDLDKIPPHNGEIEGYYTALWRRLSPLSKTISFALTSLDFKLQEEQLFSLFNDLEVKPYEIGDSFLQIRHLFRFDLQGISTFHNSFLVFVLNQPELEMQKSILYKVLENWLRKDSQKELAWSELPKIEYYLGKPELLLSINNDWIIDNYIQGKSEQLIESTIYIASKASFELKRFDKVIYFSTVLGAFRNREFNLGDTLAEIWVTAFKINKGYNILYPDFSTLTGYQIKEILIALHKNGIVDKIPNEAIDRINDLLQSNDEDYLTLVKYWLEVLSQIETNNIKRVFDFIKQFRKENKSGDLFFHYIGEILNSSQAEEIIEDIVKLRLDAEEKTAVGKRLMIDDLEKNRSQFEKYILKLLPKHHHFRSLYCKLRNNTYTTEIQIIPLNDFPSKVSFYSYEIDSVSELFEKNLFASFINDGSSSFITNTDLGEEKWLADLYNAVLEMGDIIKQHHKNKQTLNAKIVLKPLIELPNLDFIEHRDLYDYQRVSIRKIVDNVLWFASIINKTFDKLLILSFDDLCFLNNWNFYNRQSLHSIVKLPSIKINEKDLKHFIDLEEQYTLEHIIPFNEKAQRLIELSILAFNNGDHEKAQQLNTKSAQNILAYSHHKDMLLYQILESISIINSASSKRAKEFIRKIFPYVFNIEKLTDGDETRHFMGKLCSLLPKIDRELLFNQYFQYIEQREYYDIENCFDDILASLDYKDPVAKAIGGTAIEPHYSTLKKNSKDDPAAHVVLSELQERFNYSDKPEEKEFERTKINRDPNLSNVLPEKLIGYIENKLGHKIKFVDYEVSSFLLDWFKAKADSRLTEQEKKIKIIKKILNNDFSKVSSELLDGIYPTAYKFDKNFAFDCICWAHSNGGGWSMFTQNLEESRNRWTRVMRDFPERLDEFYFKTVSNVGLRYGREKDYSVPIPNSVQFFYDIGEVSTAEIIIEHYLDMLPNIFPTVSLEIPQHLTNPAKISDFDILLTRLHWISPIVRSRAAEKISELLIHDVSGEYHDCFLNYLFHEDLESRVCEGLLILIKSLQNKSSSSYKHLNQSVLDNLLSIRCMATDLIMMKISDLLNIKLNFHHPMVLTLTSAETKLSEDKFMQLVGRNLPMIYVNHVESFESKLSGNLKAWEIWCGMYEEECKFRNLKYNKNLDEDFKNSHHNHMTGRCTIFGDILKSTFFRLIDFIYQFGEIKFIDFWQLTIKNLPVDYSIWGIETIKKPKNWQEFTVNKLGEIENLSQVISSFYDNKDKNVPIYYYYSFPLNHNDSNCNSRFFEIEFTLFGYDEQFDIDIEAEDIYRKLSNFAFWYNPVTQPFRFGILDCELAFHQTKSPHSGFFPLAVPISNQTNNMWQYFRMKNNINLLSESLSSGLILENSSGILQYKNNDKVVAFYHDFLDDFKDVYRYDEPFGYGNFLNIDKSYLDKYIEKKELDIAVLVKQTLITKNSASRHDEYEKEIKYQKILVKII